MSATEAEAAPAPESGEARGGELDGNIEVDIFDDTPSSSLSELDEDEEEEDVVRNDVLSTNHSIPHSIKRRESEAAFQLADLTEHANSKKRKRVASPPWQFPTAEKSTLNTADGRRISARVHSNPPGLSENDGAGGRGRSSSLSAPPANSLPPSGLALSDLSSKSRPASPPWKKFGADGPTSVVVDGKRLSGRVNKNISDPPKRVSPRSKKVEDKSKIGGRQHGGHTSQQPESAGKGVSGHTFGKTSIVLPAQKKPTTTEISHRPSSSTSDSMSKIAELRAQIEALQPTRSFPSPEPKRSHKRKPSNDRPSQTDGPSSSPPTHRKHPRPSSGHEALRPSPKIKLRFTAPRRIIPPPHPNARIPSPTLPPHRSVFQKIEDYELLELQAPYTENERGPPDMAWFLSRGDRLAAEEGTIRQKILQEAKPGGVLSNERSSIYKDADPQKEPARQYGHEDHLVAHALHLRHLQQRERMQHRQLAKKVANEALDFWKARRGPTEEDLAAEADKIFRLIYKQVVLDVKAKWDLVASHVQQERLRLWQAEEELKRQARLQEKLEWSENMVARLRGEGGDSEDVEMSGSESSEEENMSESSSEAEEDEEKQGGGELDEVELAAYLAQREAEPPDKRRDEDLDDNGSDAEPEDGEQDDGNSENDGKMSIAGSLHPEASQDEEPKVLADVSMADLFRDGPEGGDEEEVDEEFEPEAQDLLSDVDETVDHVITDTEHSTRHSRRTSLTPGNDQNADEEEAEADLSSDQSTDMDSTDYDSDDDMTSTGEGDENVEDDEDEDGVEGSGDEQPVPNNSLLSLFREDIKKWAGLPTPTTSAEGDEREHADVQADAGAVAQEAPLQDVANANKALSRVEEMPEGAVTQMATSAPESPASDLRAEMKNLVPSPALLRGTLRSYQHTGVDWLASLYRNGTNGILADEMGLGKTIQTIALFAHLAEEHGIWDAHLVIVPTSVILNWVTEFQKFLPGFRVLGYYGTAEERQMKRRGWVNDPHHEVKDKRGYNVVITSYNVAMQDINAIRNVQWHHLVLDEAHNIRNFNSQRWQVLIRLKTRARLLLTGTPLQNSLTELWSLLTFLTAGDDDPAHGDLEEFLSHWKEPVKEIFDRGVQALSHEAQKVVDQLHISLRPFLLRRLKSEVEKDLPTKTETVVVCKLSKRQRQLYQEYMGLEDTRRSLTKGNAVTAGKVLLSLRRVCNHPDLFDPRPVQTSFAMEVSAVDGFAGTEGVVRRLLGLGERGLAVVDDVVGGNEGRRGYAVKRSRQLSATAVLEKELKAFEARDGVELSTEPDSSTLAGCLALQRLKVRQQKLEHLRASIRTSEHRLQAAAPVYGSDLRELVTLRSGFTKQQQQQQQQQQPYRVLAKDVRGRVLGRPLRGWPALGSRPLKFEMDHLSDWMLSQTSILQRGVQTAERYSERMHETIVRFAFCTPSATAPVLDYAIPEQTQRLLRAAEAYPVDADYASEARTRTSIAFPDSRLLIYDSGKLQRLTLLLRDLQARGSRSLIFTQMTGTLNILEQFLSLMNLPYLRLDGSTPVERRQLYASEFNRRDSKFQCMILSSRAGGIGLNLTGASSVIFYDLDWNPQMDRQCMDRAHRIGQVRDVEVFKLVSEKTVEENILKRAEQKSLLDRAVIQEGRFTTEWRVEAGKVEAEGDDVAAAIDRFLGGPPHAGNEKSTTLALESVEDTEDVQAAQQARKEEVHYQLDDADFDDKGFEVSNAGTTTPGRLVGDEADDEGEQEGRGHHVDTYMIGLFHRYLLRDVPFLPPPNASGGRRTDKHGRDPGHRAKRKR